MWLFSSVESVIFALISIGKIEVDFFRVLLFGSKTLRKGFL